MNFCPNDINFLFKFFKAVLDILSKVFKIKRIPSKNRLWLYQM